jgi:hypothetical protein
MSWFGTGAVVAVQGAAMGALIGAELGPALGTGLGLILGAALGTALGLALCRPLVSIVQAVSQVTAVCAIARPTMLSFVPMVLADPASTFSTKVLSAPMVRAVPRTQKTFSFQASFRLSATDKA